MNLFIIETITYNLKEVKTKLFSKYYRFLNVFDRFKANKLLSYRSYSYKIELINNFTSL